MPKFVYFKDLEKYLAKNFQKILATSKDVERIMAEAMSQAVFDVVYTHYDPIEYKRRFDDGGLSDVRNMGIMDFGINEDGHAYIIFENLTEGGGLGAEDSLDAQFLTDTIVEGIRGNWYDPDGPWSDKRDFVGETAKQLRENPDLLLEAFKKALTAKGFVVE